MVVNEELTQRRSGEGTENHRVDEVKVRAITGS
jgi:hypothetical protein